MKKEDLIEELKNKDSKINNIEDTVNQLQQMMIQFMSSSSKSPEKQEDSKSEMITVISVMNNLETIFINENKEYILKHYGDKVKIKILDCQDALLRPRNAQLFSSGLIYFENEKWYEFFGIDKPILILSKENIIEFMEKDDNEIKRILSLITQNKTNKNVEYYLLLNIAKLQNDGHRFSSESIDLLNKFFEVEGNEHIEGTTNIISDYRSIAKIKEQYIQK